MRAAACHLLFQTVVEQLPVVESGHAIVAQFTARISRDLRITSRLTCPPSGNSARSDAIVTNWLDVE